METGLGMIISITFILALSACATSPIENTSTEELNKQEVSLPTTSAGLTPLTSEQLKITFTGKSFIDVSSNWTWGFDENGFATSKAVNGDWEKQNQKWSVENGKLCRAAEGAYPCVNIYKYEDVLLFGKADSSVLETWAITEN